MARHPGGADGAGGVPPVETGAGGPPPVIHRVELFHIYPYASRAADTVGPYGNRGATLPGRTHAVRGLAGCRVHRLRPRCRFVLVGRPGCPAGLSPLAAASSSSSYGIREGYWRASARLPPSNVVRCPTVTQHTDTRQGRSNGHSNGIAQASAPVAPIKPSRVRQHRPQAVRLASRHTSSVGSSVSQNRRPAAST